VELGVGGLGWEGVGRGGGAGGVVGGNVYEQIRLLFSAISVGIRYADFRQ